MTNRIIYYRTMYNSNIRCFDLNKIDFGKVEYRAVPLDAVKQQPIETIAIEWDRYCFFEVFAYIWARYA